MSLHVRTQVRDAVIERLHDLGRVEGRIYKSRTYRLRPAELPAVRVYATGDTARRTAFAYQERVIELRVDVIGRGTTDDPDDPLDEQLDSLCGEVEALLAVPLAGSDVQIQIEYTDTSIELEDEETAPVATATLRFSCTVYQQQDMPSDINR